MSSPIRREDGDPLSYAPHRARHTAPEETSSPTSAEARASAGPPPLPPAPVEQGAVARRVAAPTPPKMNAAPQAETNESADVALPPLPRPFAGDVAIKELRRQLALDS